MLHVLRAAYPAERFVVAADLGRLHRGVGFNAVVPRARRRHDQDLPDQELEFWNSTWLVVARRRCHLRLVGRDHLVLIFAFTQARPQLLTSRTLTRSTCRSSPTIRGSRCSSSRRACRSRRVCAAERARRRCFGARAEGFLILRDRRRLLPRGLRAAGARLDLPLHALRFCSRRLHIRGLGPQRAAGLRRQQVLDHCALLTPGGAGVQQVRFLVA